MSDTRLQQRHFEKGDWVRFYRDRKLVIEQVEYVTSDEDGCLLLQTVDGQISAESVIEWRRENNR